MHIAKQLVRFTSLAAAQPLMGHRRDWRLGKRLYIIVGIIVAIATIALALFLTRGTATIVNPPFGWNHTNYSDDGKPLQMTDGGFALRDGFDYYSPTSVGDFQVKPLIDNNLCLPKFL